MSYYRNKSKKDANQDEIAKTLTTLGWEVRDVSSVNNFVDILASKNLETWQIEIKVIDHKFYVEQVETLSSSQAKCVVLISKEETLEFDKLRVHYKYAVINDKQRARLHKLAIRKRQESKATTHILVLVKDVLEAITGKL